jgi:hypothetical protein
MNKKLASIVAAAMLTLSASSAFAALSFNDNVLFRVVYDNNGIQQIANLGSVSSLMSGGVSTIKPGEINIQNAANLSVSYFALDRNNASLWVSGTSNAPTAASNGFNNLANGLDNAVHQLLASAVNGVTGTSLASLAGSTPAQVSQTLYYINDANAVGTSGIGKATIITSNTDTVVLPTPIPPAFLLMGSGLLGMRGLRRKHNIA